MKILPPRCRQSETIDKSKKIERKQAFGQEKKRENKILAKKERKENKITTKKQQVFISYFFFFFKFSPQYFSWQPFSQLLLAIIFNLFLNI